MIDSLEDFQSPNHTEQLLVKMVLGSLVKKEREPLMAKINYQDIFRGLRLWKLLNCNFNGHLGPLSLEISVTNMCNFRCVFCDTHSHLSNKSLTPMILPIEVIDNLIKNIIKLNVSEIVLSGNGEQLLLPQVIDLINSIKNALKITVLTNGSTLAKVSYDLFHYIDRISISLNSIDESYHKIIHGYHGISKYTTILGNIKRLLKYPNAKEKMQISYVIMKDNITEIDQIFSLCHELDIPFFIQPVYATCNQNRSHELDLNDINIILSKIKEQRAIRHDAKQSITTTLSAMENAITNFKLIRYSHEKWLFPCYAGFLGGFIAASGDYFLCCMCKDSLGNIIDHSFIEIWQSDKANKARYQEAMMDINGNPICYHCYNCKQSLLSSAKFHRVYSKIPFQRQLLQKNINLKLKGAD